MTNVLKISDLEFKSKETELSTTQKPRSDQKLTFAALYKLLEFWCYVMFSLLKTNMYLNFADQKHTNDDKNQYEFRNLSYGNLHGPMYS